MFWPISSRTSSMFSRVLNKWLKLVYLQVRAPRKPVLRSRQLKRMRHLWLVNRFQCSALPQSRSPLLMSLLATPGDRRDNYSSTPIWMRSNFHHPRGDSPSHLSRGCRDSRKKKRRQRSTLRLPTNLRPLRNQKKKRSRPSSY